MNLSWWTFRWKWGPVRETFSGEGQPSICAMGVAHLSCWVVRSKSETRSLLVSSNCSWGPWPCIPLWLHLCPLHLFIVKLLKGKVPWLTPPYVLFSLSHCTVVCFLFSSLKLHWPISVIANYWMLSPYLHSLCRIWLSLLPDSSNHILLWFPRQRAFLVLQLLSNRVLKGVRARVEM